LDLLLDYLQEQRKGSKEELFETLVTISEDLIKAQPSMASVFNRVNFVLRAAKEIFAQIASVEEAKTLIIREIHCYQNDTKKALERIAELGSEIIPHRGAIITYSASSLVEAILTHTKQPEKTFTVIVPESRPMCEGTQMALRLSKQKVKCILIADAAISKFIGRADVGLVGADRVTEETLVNKVGTRGIALVARAASVPVYAAFETDKFLPRCHLPVVDRQEDPAQVCQTTNQYLTVQNIYFEETPLNCFSGLITEKGILKPEKLKPRLGKLSVVQELTGFSAQELKGESDC
jgi:translation initiation factor 2B subunit (eIF-2B alpha/beta/delta family)